MHAKISKKADSDQKDIKINIQIENNLLSKNKIKHKEETDETKPPDAPKKQGANVAPNSNMSRLLSEYYGVMAQRDLYRQSINQPNPMNLIQNFPYAPQNTGTTQQPSGTYIQYLPNTTPNSQQPQQEEEDDEEDDDILNQTVVEEENEPANEGDEYVPTQPHITLAVVSKQQLLGSIIEDPDKEREFVDGQSEDWQERRNELIARIKDEPTRIRLNISDILRYKLGYYVRQYRFRNWKTYMKKAKD